MKYHAKGFEYIPLIILSVAAFNLPNHFDVVVSTFSNIMTVMTPFFWAFAFAYLINPLVMLIENRLKCKRILSVSIAYGVILSIFALVIKFIFPEIATSASDILRNMPRYISGIEGILKSITKQYPELFNNPDTVEPLNQNIQSITEFGATLINTLILSIIGFANHILKLAIGIVISIYFLMDKEKFIMGSKKIIYGLLETQTADYIMEIGKETNEIFSKFIIGKTIDSCIIGLICYLGMIMIDVPYPILFALIVGITNMIPFFGPFIGGIPVSIITFIINPAAGLWTALFILVLQQFDGYILGPKILGDSVGMSGIWIIVSIIVGGSLLGVLGMLIAVPTTAILRHRINAFLNKRIEQKGIEFQ